MAYRCDNCDKSRMMGHRVSHSKRRTNHAFKPNLQYKRIMVDGRSVRVRLCTNCIKRMKKNALDAKAALAEQTSVATV